jgi:hypothetical protein
MEPPATIAEASRAARGFGNAFLAPVRQLNAYFLETLIHCSRHPAWCGSRWEMALGPNPADVPPTVWEELSRSPVSLVEVGLNEGSSTLLAQVDTARTHSPPAFLARDRALHLTQVTLALLWTLARSDLVVASIVFGVSRSIAKEISALGFHDLPAISERLAPAVRPRWLGRPRIWRRLLRCPDRAITAHLPPRNVRVLQRQLADLIPATPAKCLFDDDRRWRRS